ncbi:MAG: outer membrane protein assembly factor BamA [Candidatus Competibacterales bacterium]
MGRRLGMPGRVAAGLTTGLAGVLLLGCLGLWAPPAQGQSLLGTPQVPDAPPAAAGFVVEDVRVEGLQRISAGTVFNFLPVEVGDRVAPDDYPALIRALFQSGFFADVVLSRDGNTLVVRVIERPAIAELTFEGNRDLDDEGLRQALREINFIEGEVFNRSTLEQVERSLIDLYFSRGKYAVRIDTDVRPLPRNRVAVEFDISEGIAARIRDINIVGNRAFDEDELLDLFQLSTTGLFTLFTRSDQYSRIRLQADLETLEAFYLDRGYLRFAVDSTQVTITPDRTDIYITINISEGEPFLVSGVELVGELPVPREEVEGLIDIEVGEPLSRRQVQVVAEDIQRRLGDEGYAFAQVVPQPALDEAANTVALTLAIDPGPRVYVRRIDIEGNITTQDEVVRRELRQLEGAPFSNQAMERSRTRLERLSFLSQVEVDTDPVPEVEDQVDVTVSVEERPAGNLLFGVGFGQTEGLLINASLNQDNFLGTGDQLNLTFNNSSANTRYSFSYNEPYYTVDGISRGFRLSFEEFDAGQLNTGDYSTDELLGTVNFGFPLNENDTVRLGLGLEYLRLDDNDDTPEEISFELEEEGDTFLNGLLTLSFARDTRNRAIFADEGSLNRVSGEATFPGSGAQYYKINLRHQSFFPLTNAFTLALRGNLGYGDGYGGTEELPFFENYFAGGLTTVRGYKANTLGPRYDNDEPSGGSVRLTGGFDVIFPIPFLEASQAFRLALFADGGNVFGAVDEISFGELRFSAGVGARWLSPLGPLALSFALPLNDEDDDDTEVVQFSFGVPF